MAAIVNSLYTLCGCHALLFRSCCSLSSCPHSRLPSTPLTLLVCFLSALSTPLCPSPLTILPAPPALSSPFPVSLPSHPSTLFFKTPPHLPLRTHTVCANPLRPTFIGKALYTYHYIRDTECPLPRQRNATCRCGRHGKPLRECLCFLDLRLLSSVSVFGCRLAHV